MKKTISRGKSGHFTGQKFGKAYSKGYSDGKVGKRPSYDSNGYKVGPKKKNSGFLGFFDFLFI